MSNNKLFQILYTKGRIACKLLNAIFYCGKSTSNKYIVNCVLFALTPNCKNVVIKNEKRKKPNRNHFR